MYKYTRKEQRTRGERRKRERT